MTAIEELITELERPGAADPGAIAALAIAALPELRELKAENEALKKLERERWAKAADVLGLPARAEL